MTNAIRSYMFWFDLLTLLIAYLMSNVSTTLTSLVDEWLITILRTPPQLSTIPFFPIITISVSFFIEVNVTVSKDLLHACH